MAGAGAGGAAAANSAVHPSDGSSPAGRLRRWQISASVAYYGVVWFLGLQSGLIGPTLGGIAALLGEESGAALAPQFTCRAGGFLAGTLAVGVVFDVSARQHVTLAAGTVGLAAGLVILPSMRTTAVYYALYVPVGLCMGFIDTGVNLLILAAWKGGNATPWMNFLHFVSSCHRNLADHNNPLLSCCEPESEVGDGGLLFLQMWGVGSFMSPLLLTVMSVPASFRTVAACGMAAAVLPLLLPSPAAHNPTLRRERDKAQRQKQQQQQQQSGAKGRSGAHSHAAGGQPAATADRSLFLLPTAAGFLVFLFYVGLEAGYGAWLATYLVERGITDAEGAALLTSVYWGALTVGRLLAVPLAVYISPARLIVVDMVAAVVSAAAFQLLGSSKTGVTVISVAIGLSLASIFASTLAVAETRMPFSGRRASIVIAGASSGEVVLPLVIGALFDRFGVEVFPRCILVFSIAMSCAFAVLVTRPVYQAATCHGENDQHEMHSDGMAVAVAKDDDGEDDDGETKGLMSKGPTAP